MDPNGTRAQKAPWDPGPMDPNGTRAQKAPWDPGPMGPMGPGPKWVQWDPGPRGPMGPGPKVSQKLKKIMQTASELHSSLLLQTTFPQYHCKLIVCMCASCINPVNRWGISLAPTFANGRMVVEPMQACKACSMLLVTPPRVYASLHCI